MVLLPLLAMSQDKVVHDENVVQRTVPEFHSVRVNSAINLYLTKADEQNVMVSSSDKNSVSQLTTIVKEGVLYIGFKDLKWSNKTKLNAYVSYTELKSIQADGATRVEFVEPIKQSSLQVLTSGASTLLIKMDVDDLTVKLTGASTIKAQGKAKNAILSLSGASTFKGFELYADESMISATGASKVEVHNMKEINVAASGASDILWKGPGSLNASSTSGASKVKKIQ